MSAERVIATEEHYSSPAFNEAAAELDVWEGDAFEMQGMRSMSDGPWYERLTDLDVRLAEMDASGTDLSVLSLQTPTVQAYAPADAATALAQRYNDELAELVGQRPTRFAGLGVVAPQDPEAAAQEIGRVMGPLGLGGIMICSHTQGRYLDDPFFEPLVAAAEENAAPIYLHPRMPSPGQIGPYRDYGMPAAVWGYQADAGTHAVRLMLSGLLDRHPDLKLVLGHLGEGLPLWMERLDNRYAFTYEAVGRLLGMVKLELTPTEYLHRNFVVTTSGMPDHGALGFCLERLGEDRIMFAVDYPYEDSAEATEFLRTADLTDDQRAKISHGNAERLFRIPPAANSSDPESNNRRNR
jgi:predicted TIM-barrel fold metal-dependent hydrolase